MDDGSISIILKFRLVSMMMDFCADHNITSDVEVIASDYIGAAYERTIASDVKYRFVIDASTL